MDLTHRFTVPTDVETTWAHFQDIAGLAECFPGASLSEADESTFTGSVKVKLGPIALVYNGSGTFVDKDETAHSFKVDAKGKDKRGNGTAGAKVTLSMEPATGGGTEVEVLTDLAITGKPAQFGRGVMQDVSDKLLGQFVDCLERKLATEPEVHEPAAPAAPTSAEADPEPGAGSTTLRSVPDTGDDSTVVDPAAPVAPAAGAAGSPRPDPAAVRSTGAGSHKAAGSDDALDLGAAVIPILAKTYWKQAAGVAVGIAVVTVLVRRRR